MSTTLVGVFDKPGQAYEASRKLATAGIEESAIRLSGDETAADQREPRETTAPAHEQGAISRFFSELFGMNANDAANYTEAVQRGHVVLTVDLADDSRVDEIADILEDCGAVDVDERVERWKADGYQPPGSDAPRPGGSQSGGVRIHRRGVHESHTADSAIEGAGGRDYLRVDEFEVRDVERAPVHGGSFGVGYGGVERRSGTNPYSGVDRRARG